MAKLVVLGMRRAKHEVENQTKAKTVLPTIDSGRRESRRLQIKKETVSPSKASVSSDGTSGTSAGDHDGGDAASATRVPVAWAWLLLSACIGKQSNLSAAVESLVAARGGPDIQDGSDKEEVVKSAEKEEEVGRACTVSIGDPWIMGGYSLIVSDLVLV